MRQFHFYGGLNLLVCLFSYLLTWPRQVLAAAHGNSDLYCSPCGLLVAACGILFPDQGLNPGTLHWERGVLATGPPGSPWTRPLLSGVCLVGVCSGKASAWRCRRHKGCRFHPWTGRSPGRGNDNPFQDSCLGNLMDRGAWRACISVGTRHFSRAHWPRAARVCRAGEHSGSSAEAVCLPPCMASRPGALLIARLVTLYLVCVRIIRSRALFHAP